MFESRIFKIFNLVRTYFIKKLGDVAVCSLQGYSFGTIWLYDIMIVPFLCDTSRLSYQGYLNQIPQKMPPLYIKINLH